MFPLRTPAAPVVRSLALALLLGLSGCSTEKDAFLNRTFHRLTARDNGWFNANEKLSEAVANMERSYQDDFDQVLPIFIYGTEEQAKSMSKDMDACIDKCAVVIDRHSMEIKEKERNTWIDDAYFVIGKSHFYKRSYYEAMRTFDYVGRRYKGQDKQQVSRIWQARAAIELEQYGKANTILDELRNEKVLPKKFPHDELSAVQAHLEMRRGKVDDAIVNLERAVSVARKKKDKVRWTFILAQLYQNKGKEKQAIDLYARVTRMSPPYEIGFHAQIFQALAFDRGNSKAIRQKLNRMLKDDKHVDHYDMLHYALAELDLKEGQQESAIDHLRTSCRVSTTDTRQKAKSYLRLADIYFEDRAYKPAQQYYDSTASLLAQEHQRYKEVTTRAEVLGDLVEQLDIIAREDSLQALAGLDPEQRERVIRRLIRERAEAEEARKAQELEARETTSTAATPKPTTPSGTSQGEWYFYNPQALARGLTDFRKKWGARALEDDWRRKDKSGTAAADMAEQEVESIPDQEKEKEGEGKEPWRDPETYLRDIPLEPEALAASNAMVCEAMYKSGMIYKEKLQDVDNAVESFEVLINRFEDCLYLPETHYQLFRIYLEKESSDNYFSPDGTLASQTYADIILERWPDSEFARLVRNPDALHGDEAKRLLESAEYEQVYRDFRQGRYMQVVSTCNRVLAEEPNNHLRPKYALLKAMAVGALREMAAFRNALGEVKGQFPGTEEAKAAEDILAKLDGLDKPATPGPADKPPGGSPKSSFKPASGQHYFALIYPTGDGDIAAVKNQISDFNRSKFKNMTIQVASSPLDREHQVILLSVFETKEKAMEYYSQFLSELAMLQGINDQGYVSFAISPDNYAQLYKSKDVEGYSAFFQQNYLAGR